MLGFKHGVLVPNKSFMLPCFYVIAQVEKSVKASGRFLALIVVFGVCIGLVSGFVENTTRGASIPENKYYGYPLVWRLSDAFTGEKYYYFELVIDCIFWIVIVSAVALLAQKLLKHNEKV